MNYICVDLAIRCLWMEQPYNEDFMERPYGCDGPPLPLHDASLTPAVMAQLPALQ